MDDRRAWLLDHTAAAVDSFGADVWNGVRCRIHCWGLYNCGVHSDLPITVLTAGILRKKKAILVFLPCLNFLASWLVSAIAHNRL